MFEKLMKLSFKTWEKLFRMNSTVKHYASKMQKPTFDSRCKMNYLFIPFYKEFYFYNLWQCHFTILIKTHFKTINNLSLCFTRVTRWIWPHLHSYCPTSTLQPLVWLCYPSHLYLSNPLAVRACRTLQREPWFPSPPENAPLPAHCAR